MIAHLESMFWSNSEADVNLPSPNTSSDSCVTASNLLHFESECYSAVSLVNTAEDWCLVDQSQTVSATNNAIAGEKRTFPMDEQSDKSKNTNKKHRTITQVSRALSSKALGEKTNTYLANQNSSLCCSSEDDSNGVCDESVALKQSGSSRGRSRSSMNSQSLYAKKRRERINEKLRILQQLIPNGTKVDISTMLEEAVQYVKFLQLQIKLLSSDETWIYAPLAYNGVAIDLGDSANIS
ncbi:hypothetical protein QOZ80_9AG0690300 [Eleusine coracana subsp. coracana]|nr:hypothetical protein QOZ80_9AG0690300 [Eleusine coracana subsp. coracana]